MLKRQEDHLNPGVWDQQGQHGETPSVKSAEQRGWGTHMPLSLPSSLKKVLDTPEGTRILSFFKCGIMYMI